MKMFLFPPRNNYIFFIKVFLSVVSCREPLKMYNIQNIIHFPAAIILQNILSIFSV